MIVATVAAAIALVGGCPLTGILDGNAAGPIGTKNTTDKTNGGAAFVGSSACRTCHADINAVQSLHGHNWILNPIQGGPPVYPDAAVRAGVPNPPDGFEWSDISWVIGGFAKRALFINRDGFVLSSGATGVDTLWNLDFPPSGRTTGFAPYEAERTDNKPGDFSCFQCHTTGPLPPDAANPRFQEGRPGFAGTWEEAGVQCEACHGPGSKHFAKSGDQVIIDRSRIFIDTTAKKTCFQCHNEPFDSNADVLHAKDGFVEHAQQYTELTSSGGHSKFACTMCHDPHRSVLYDRENAIRNECVVCHVDQSMALHEGKVFVGANGYIEKLACQSCHMSFATKTGSARLVPVVDFNGKAIGDNQARIADTRTHIFRINTDEVDYKTMFNAAGDAVVRDAQGRSAVTVDFVCQRCHNGTGSAFGLPISSASEIALGMHAGVTLPGGTGGSAGGGTGDGSGQATGSAAGRSVYEGICINCHSLGAFDTVGFAGDLKTLVGAIVNDLGTLNPAMFGITLTDTEIADVKAFIAEN